MMNKLTDTLSLCEHCYRHVPATKFERDGQIWLWKKCKFHGESEHLIEPDAEFYLNYKYPRRSLTSYMLDITNRCNLTCPNCHQEPDNQTNDLPIDYYVDIVQSWPNDGYPVALCGAEPTVRKDLPEFIETLNNLPGKHRHIFILTNAVKLSKKEYVEQFTKFNNVSWTIGLNHPEYQGHKVRAKQMKGIRNLVELNQPIKNISYTLEVLDQMEYCLEEIQEFAGKYCNAFRVRTGVDIGRYPGGPKVYMSDLVKEMQRVADKNNWPVVKIHDDGNRAHYAVTINGILVKIIQWPDVTTLDLKEIQTEGIGDFVPGKPRSPLIHQVMLRDAFINKGMPLYDTIPQEYIDNYGNQRN
jgi:organic radical activating enzyme